MRRVRVLSVVGTRPNFMKIAPIARELAHRPDTFDHVLVHTGQHYDDAMAGIFMKQLGIREPNHVLDVGSGSHARQLARILERFEPVIAEVAPDVILVPGDVNSTLGAALAAAAAGITIGHVEAGLRSFDRSMPEELNRVLVDTMSALLFIHSADAHANLIAEGRDAADVYDVGNTMIDTLVRMRPAIDAVDVSRWGVTAGGYLVVTLHRPALVDDRRLLGVAIAALEDIARAVPVVFPVHPRTRHALHLWGLEPQSGGITLAEPLGYLDFLGLVSRSRGVVTDSGGVQEETTYLQVPCLTLRANTERPVTVDHGTNVLLGLDPARIREALELIEAIASRPPPPPPPGWDGRAAKRIADVLAARCGATTEPAPLGASAP